MGCLLPRALRTVLCLLTYEPVESRVQNLLYKQRDDPTVELYDVPLNPIDPEYPIVATNYRLTEHYLSGPMSRFNSWLNELQPEMFVEISPELAREKGIEHGGWLVVWNSRAAIEARAMVTGCIRPLRVQGKFSIKSGCPSIGALPGRQ